MRASDAYLNSCVCGSHSCPPVVCPWGFCILHLRLLLPLVGFSPKVAILAPRFCTPTTLRVALPFQPVVFRSLRIMRVSQCSMKGKSNLQALWVACLFFPSASFDPLAPVHLSRQRSPQLAAMQRLSSISESEAGSASYVTKASDFRKHC